MRSSSDGGQTPECVTKFFAKAVAIERALLKEMLADKGEDFTCFFGHPGGGVKQLLVGIK